MAVWTYNTRMAVRLRIDGAEQRTADIETGQTLEPNFLYGITISFNAVPDPRIERWFLRQRPQPSGKEHLFFYLSAFGLPRFARGIRLWHKLGIGVRQVSPSRVHTEFLPSI
jgi:hypothetical protein